MTQDVGCFELDVVKAVGLRSVLFGKSPKAYVRIQVDRLVMQTRIAQRSKAPVWDERFQISVSKDLSSHLSFRVMHTSSLCDRFLGSLNITIKKLVELAVSSNDVKLDLADSSGNVTGKRGFIFVRLIQEDLEKLGADAIAFAHTTPLTSGISRTADISDANPVDSIAAGINAVGLMSVTESLGNILSKLDVLVNVVDQVAKVHPYLNLAWTVTSSLYHAVKGQLDRDAQLMKLVSIMEDTYSFVDAVDIRDKIKVLEDTIMSILQQTVECVLFIREYSGHGFGGRVITQTFTNKAQHVQDFIARFRDLKESLDNTVGLQTAFVSMRAAEGIERLLVHQDLESLHPALMDASQRMECQPDTRVDILKFITDWLVNPSEQNALWLHGMEGCGKSTIATTIASLFRDLGRLGAFLFFDQPTKVDPSHFTRTLAYHLGCSHPRIGSAISAAIASNPRIAESPLRLQFTKLILEPLSSLDELCTQGPVVIVLDALDGCGEPDSRKLLLRILAEDFKKLPNFLRIFITSRPQHDIDVFFSTQPHVCKRELEVSTESNFQDVGVYLRQRLNEIRGLNEDLDLPSDWPGDDAISNLSRRSDGLFVWCSTAVVFIGSGQDPDERLKILLRSNPEN